MEKLKALKVLLCLEYSFGVNGSFIGENYKKIWKVGPLYIFRSVWKIKNGIAFVDEMLST